MPLVELFCIADEEIQGRELVDTPADETIAESEWEEEIKLEDNVDRQEVRPVTSSSKVAR